MNSERRDKRELTVLIVGAGKKALSVSRFTLNRQSLIDRCFLPASRRLVISRGGIPRSLRTPTS